MKPPVKLTGDRSQIAARPFRAVRAAYERVVTSLGGEGQLSEMEMMCAELLAMGYVLAREQYPMARQGNELAQRNWHRATSLTAKCLTLLGLKRKPKVLDAKVFELKDWQRGQEQVANPANTEAL